MRARLWLAVLYALFSVSHVDAAKPEKPKPVENPGYWFSSDDYPLAALAHRAEGNTSVKLDIGADGRVGTCNVAHSSGNATLDEAACTILRERGKFFAARDSKGRAVGGTFETRVLWKLPRPNEIRVDASPIRLNYVIDVDQHGNVTHCEVLEKKLDLSHARFPESVDPCTRPNANQAGFTVVDKDGNSINARVSYRWELIVTPLDRAVPDARN